MIDNLHALRLFVRVARTGSFSRAGRELGLSQPSVSRIVAQLEQEIGAALFTRTTRALSLTEAGIDYLARLEPLLAALDEAEHAARGTGELRGQLRIGVSSSLAIRELIPRLPAFLEEHPALRVDLAMSDQRQDLVSEGVDVALRLGELPDSATATARLLARGQRMLVASRAYLERHGRPGTPADLAAHAIIAGPMRFAGESWTFKKEGRVLSVRVEGRITVSTNEGAVAAAVAGLGVVATSQWGCRAELEGGVLVRVLPDWEMGTTALHAIFAAGRAAKPSARALVDHLAGSLGNKTGGP